jgi:hypothetical protein
VSNHEPRNIYYSHILVSSSIRPNLSFEQVQVLRLGIRVHHQLLLKFSPFAAKALLNSLREPTFDRTLLIISAFWPTTVVQFVEILYRGDLAFKEGIGLPPIDRRHIVLKLYTQRLFALWSLAEIQCPTTTGRSYTN